MARAEKKTTYRNLIDVIISLEEKKMGNEEVFQKVLIEYFFRKECEEKKFLAFLKSFEVPSLMKQEASLADIVIKEFSGYVEGSDPVESLAGKIMLSKPYLKTFYQNHQPEFNKLPPDVQMEILDGVKNRNRQIMNAFRKMHEDREADRSRTVMRLVALILKNIQIRTGLPFAEMKISARDAINEIFSGADDIFRAAPPQVAVLSDDKNIKKMIKVFFVIRKNQDLTDISDYFRKEFDRFKKRAEKAFLSE